MRIGPLDFVVIVEIQFQQVAAGDGVTHVVLRRHFGNGHAVVVHPHLLDQKIRTDVFPVQDQLHRHAAGGPGKVGHHRGHFHRHKVPHQGPVHEIGQQHPTLVLVHPEDVLLFFQFDQVGFLGPVPGRVPAAADLASGLFQTFILTRPANLDGGLDECFLGSDGFAVFRIDINRRQAGLHQNPVSGALAAYRKVPGGDIGGR